MNLRSVFSLALGTLLSVFLAACSCSKKQPDNPAPAPSTKCKTTAECTGGQVCVNLECVAAPTCTPSTLCKCDGTDGDVSCGGINLDPGGTADEASQARQDLLNNSPNEGVTLGPDGLQLKGLPPLINHYVWISNTGAGYVQKFSAEQTNADGTFKELARYYVGPRHKNGARGGFETDTSPKTLNRRGNDPSRTSVDTIGDVFVANRSGRRVTKFAGRDTTPCLTLAQGGMDGGGPNHPDCFCKDRNGNGQIDTATSPSDIRNWGEDECLLWSTEVRDTSAQPPCDSSAVIAGCATGACVAGVCATGGAPCGYGPCATGETCTSGLCPTEAGIAAVGSSVTPGDVSKTDFVRALAAQDIYSVEGSTRTEAYIWVGGWNDTMNKPWVYKLNGSTGEKLLEVPSPVYPYGFAFDQAKNLWISTRGGQGLGRIDTARCHSSTDCGDSVCVGNDATCDAAVRQEIPLPANYTTGYGKNFYGITVDYKQRVWLAGDCVFRYDRGENNSKAFDKRWSWYHRGGAGISADGMGFIYVGGGAAGIYVYPGDDFVDGAELTGTYPAITGTAAGSGQTPVSSDYGLGIVAKQDPVTGADKTQIWGIHIGERPTSSATLDFATVVEPEVNTTPVPASLKLADMNFKLHTVTGTDQRKSAVGIDFPYTYSDMTGDQLRLATAKNGFFSYVFEACAGKTSGVPSWQELSWITTNSVPTGTHIVWYVRTADTCTEMLTDRCKTLSGDYVLVGSTDGNPAPLIMDPALLESVFVSDDPSQPNAKVNRNKRFLEVKAVLAITDPSVSAKTPRIASFEASSTCNAIAQ